MEYVNYVVIIIICLVIVGFFTSLIKAIKEKVDSKMKNLDTLIKVLEKEKSQAQECKCLNTAKSNKDYYSYLEGKEEAFELCLKLIHELERNENQN